MKLTIKYQGEVQFFEDKAQVTIGNSSNCDFCIQELTDEEVFKLVWAQDYNKFVLVNVYKNQHALSNNKTFSKVLLPQKGISLKLASLSDVIEIKDESKEQELVSISKKPIPNNVEAITKEAQNINSISQNPNNIFNCETERNRVSIIKEIGFKILELKNNLKTAERINFILSANIGILSLVSAFAVTNFLLGLQIDSSSNGLNLTTNFWFLLLVGFVILAVCIAFKYAVSTMLWNKHIKKQSNNTGAQSAIMNTCVVFLFAIYVINLCYYKVISVFSSFFISLLFVGGLFAVTIGSGYFYNGIKILKEKLTVCEYREDFESVVKNYRELIHIYVNKLSQNKIQNIRNSMLNNQMKAVVEGFVGFITAPFLAYGVSNTLAGCFPEAASWIRISGIRFSPIFLVLATFMIIFAFICYVKAFTIGKKINGSQTIKFDGFHNYSDHGVNLLGLDSMNNLEKEKRCLLYIASAIIVIEFSMNVSYFITEMGGDIQGMLISLTAALVPTALLVAETNILSNTMFHIENSNELLEMLD